MIGELINSYAEYLQEVEQANSTLELLDPEIKPSFDSFMRWLAVKKGQEQDLDDKQKQGDIPF